MTVSETRNYHVPAFRVALVREPGVSLADRPAITNSSAAADLFRRYIGDVDREHFVIAMLTVRHRLIGLHTVSIGCLTSSLVHPREVMKSAIVSSAGALVLAHNHPSGDPEPSAEDIALTRRLVSCGTLLGIEILDHIVIGNPGHVSLKERGHV
jgi:DNA repair protein RadC